MHRTFPLQRAVLPLVVLLVALATLACAPKLAAQGASPAASDSLSDDFQRGSLGPNWTIYNGDVTLLGGVLGLASRKGDMLGLGMVAWSGTTFSADQFSETRIAAGKPADALVQVFVRRRASDLQRYGFHWNSGFGGRWELKLDGSRNPTVLAARPAEAPRPGDVLRIEVVGSTLRGLYNGVEVLRAGDPTAALPAPGQPGLALNAFAVQRFPVAFVTAWSGGSLVNGFSEPASPDPAPLGDPAAVPVEGAPALDVPAGPAHESPADEAPPEQL